ncbi:hypothetical protein EDB19DRAFT_1685688 [Suillus lakei]|nr:hypothetical protein EDB19DRAFT_1685688 [Suillus lakei]
MPEVNLILHLGIRTTSTVIQASDCRPTTLIGAPTPIVASISAQVPDSTEIGEACMQFRCGTNVTVHISFGGTKWAISPLGMNLGNMCWLYLRYRNWQYSCLDLSVTPS